MRGLVPSAILGAGVAVTALSAALLVAPQAVAVDQPNVPISQDADSVTRAVAQADMAAAAAAMSAAPDTH